MRPRGQILAALSLIVMFTGCQTAETGGKVIDRSRGEIVLSSTSDSRSALPEGSKDRSLSSARENLEKMIASNPRDVASLTSLAQLQLAQDRFREADETCLKILRIDIKNQEARKILAQAAIRMNEPDRALIFLTSLGGSNSRDSSVINMLGLVSMAKGDSVDAMRLWKQAITLNSNDISARMNLGVMYLKYRMMSQASVHFERVLKVAPNHQDALLHMAIIDASKGMHEKSMIAYNQILSKDSSNPLALFNLAVSQDALGQYDDAAKTLKSYIRVSASKSAETDQAFALLETVNMKRQSQGKKVSDDEIRELAENLDKKKPSDASAMRKDQSSPQPAAKKARDNVATGKEESVNALSEMKQNQKAPQNQVKSDLAKDGEIAKTKSRSKSLGADQDIEELEKELLSH